MGSNPTQGILAWQKYTMKISRISRDVTNKIDGLLTILEDIGISDIEDDLSEDLSGPIRTLEDIASGKADLTSEEVREALIAFKYLGGLLKRAAIPLKDELMASKLAKKLSVGTSF